MTDLSESNFGVLDYCLLAGVLIITGAIGLYTSYIGNKSPEEFLMGNRSLKHLPVTMSLLTSFISPITVLGFSGEAYAYGMQLSLFLFGAAFGIKFSSYFILPVLYHLKLTSINEYIELRFKSKGLKGVILFLALIRSALMMGVLLYAPTIVLSHVTNLSVIANIFLLGIICTLYSSFGGIRAVIWTDVFQLSVIVIGLISVAIVGCIQNGGFFKVLYISSEGGRLDVFNMDPSPFVRYTFFNVLALGVFAYIRVYCSGQVMVQRMCTVGSIKKAKKVLNYNIYGQFLINFLIFTGGLAAYVSYLGCDPLALGIIKRKEQIMTYFIVDKLRFVPGLPGIFVATLISGSLSSLSSMINATVAMIWRDVSLRFSFFQNTSSGFSTLTNKILSSIVGVIIIGLAILTSYAGNILEYVISVTGALSGPILGVYFIGYFLPRCNIKGVWTGFIVSIIISAWIGLGGLLYKKPTNMLPLSTEECDPWNLTLVNTSMLHHFTTNNKTEDIDTDNFLQPLYQISNTLYEVISSVLCIILAVIVSLLTGNQRIEETSPRYISPPFRKFYWKKEELKLIQEEESNLKSSKISEEEIMLDQCEIKH